MPSCRAMLRHIYDRLGILPFDHTLGESFYNPMLPDVVRDLQAKGIATESRGAIAIFFGANEPPTLVRKSDGSFTYTTTDLATIRYRITQWRPDAILYVVDSRQGLHFKQLFDAARRWGYDAVALEHVSFGSVLDEGTRKPLKTREGVAASLDGLLDAAVAQAERVALENQETQGPEETILVGTALAPGGRGRRHWRGQVRRPVAEP